MTGFTQFWDLWVTGRQEDRKALMADLIACVMFIAMIVIYYLVVQFAHFLSGPGKESFFLILNKISPGMIDMPESPSSASSIGDDPSAATQQESYGALLYVTTIFGLLIYGRLMRLTLGKYSYPIIGLIMLFFVGCYLALDFFSIYYHQIFVNHASYVSDVIFTIGLLCGWYLYRTKKLALFFDRLVLRLPKQEKDVEIFLETLMVFDLLFVLLIIDRWFFSFSAIFIFGING